MRAGGGDGTARLYRYDRGLTPCPSQSTSISTPSNMTFSPPPPVTMHDLPLETIGNIVHLAYPANAAGKKQKRRRRFLLKASLVCRSWKPFAQKALWHSVRLDGSSIARFVASGAGRYPIKNLYVADVPSTSQDDPVDALLTSVRGVQHLSLSNLSCNGMSLSHRNFQGE